MAHLPRLDESKKFPVVMLLLLVLTSLATPQGPRPANDNFANAQTINSSTGRVTGSNVNATKEPNEPNHAGNAGGASVWYRWQAPSSGPFTFTTLGSTFDTLLAVYTGGSVGALSFVVSNDDRVGRSSSVTFNAVAGTTYQIAVDGYNNATGVVVLSWSPPPANDAFANAQPIFSNTGSVASNNIGATKEPGEPNHAGNFGGASVWYRWQAPSSGPVIFTTTGSEINTLLAIYTGSTFNTLAVVGSNDDQVGSTTSAVLFTAVAGTVYRIAVDGSGGLPGNFRLTWSPPPPNDNFANAQPISGPAGSVAGNNIGATIEPDELALTRVPRSASVWYRWSAPASGVVTFSVTSSSFEPDLDVYIGSSLNTLAELFRSFNAVAGTTYYVRVRSRFNGMGSFTLNWSFTPPPPNDNFANPQVINGNAGRVTGSNVNATKELFEPNHAGNSGGASVWYRWQAPTSGPITFTTAGSQFNTLLAVYTGSSILILAGVASNDDRPGDLTSVVSFNAVAGTVYRIAVDGFGGGMGDLVLAWAPTPGNDNFANAQPISGPAGSVAGSTIGATREVNEPDHTNSFGSASVWYRWQAPSSGNVTFTVDSSNFNAALAVYIGNTLSTLTPVVKADPQVRFAVEAGRIYQIAVDGRSRGIGPFVLTWLLIPPPANDRFANAQPISGGAGSLTATNSGATHEPGEPDHAGRMGGPSVWYRWQAPGSGPATFTTFGSDFGTLLAVYTGSVVNALTPIASATGNGQARFNAAAGTTYFIAVDGVRSVGFDDRGFGFGEQGKLVLKWRLGAPANDGFASAQPLVGTAGSVITDDLGNLGATKETGEPNHAGNAGGTSLWYRWQAPGSGPVTFTTLGSGFDTLLAVYAGSSLNALSPVVSNDDFALGRSQVTFAAAAGATYLIAVDGWKDVFDTAGQTGQVVLTWHLNAPPNDRFADAQPLIGITGVAVSHNHGATKEPGEPNHAGQPGGRSIWYRWQAPSSGPATFSTFGSSLDTVLAVYTGTAVNTLTQVASNDDDAQMKLLTSKVTFTATAGTIYWIAVDGLGGRAGDIILRWNVGARISGRATMFFGGKVPFATVVLSGDESRTVLTDAAGYYTFANLRAGGSYSVKAFVTSDFVRLSSTFAPLSYSPLSGDVENADLFLDRVSPVVGVSGLVRDARGNGLPGVTVVLSGDRSGTIVTDGIGGYLFTELDTGGNFVVTPTSSVYQFAPPYRYFGALVGDVVGADFTASETYLISGQVRATNGQPLPGVTIAISGTQQPPALTDADGNYSFLVSAGGTYTLTPARPSFTFSQPSRTFSNLSQNQKTVDFTAIPLTAAIRGRVTLDGNGLGGITVSLSGSASRTTTTAPSGDYSFTDLASGGNYTVSPARPNFIFTPPSLIFNNLSQDQTANFTATPPTVTILATDPTASEPGTDTGTFTLTRSGPPEAALTVSYSISGTATNGVDYEAIPSAVTIPAGATTASIVIRPIDDSLVEGPETVTLTLASGSDYQVGSPNAATVTIADDDLGATAGSGLQYYPLPRPVRLLDTRLGFAACDTPGAPLGAGATRSEAARVSCEGLAIPAAAQALVGNATVVNLDGSGRSISAGGYVTLYPSGAAMPTVSNLNYGASQVVANAFTVGLGADGAFNLFASGGTHVIVDVTGYYAPPGAGGLYYHPLPRPVRLLDTRPGFSACDSPGALLAAAATRTEAARVNCEGLAIPAAAQAIVGNATVVNLDSSGKTISGGGYLTLYPSGAAMPTVSNLNYGASQVVANAFTVGLGADGAFNLFASGGTHVIIDVTGYYSAEATDVNGAGLLYQPLGRPVRLLDTRPGFSACDSPGALLAAAATRTEAARVNCEGLAIPAAAQAVVGNATVVNLDSNGKSISGGGYLTLYPSGAAMPTVSNLNYGASQVVANAFTVGLGADGAFNIFASGGTHFIIDVTGYYAAGGTGSPSVSITGSDSTVNTEAVSANAKLGEVTEGRSNLTWSSVPTVSHTSTAKATDDQGPAPTSSLGRVTVGNQVTNTSAANYQAGAFASEAIVAAFGPSLATATLAATTTPLPTSLAGTTVTVRDSAGTERLAPLFFVSPTQVNYQIPAGMVTGLATATIASGNGVISTGTLQIDTVGPGLFAANVDGRDFAAAMVLRARADGTQSYEPVVRFDAVQHKFVAVPIDLGPATDQIFLLLFGTGIRYQSSLSAINAAIGGVNWQVLYAGPQGGFVGLDQVNVRLDRSLIGRGEVEVVLEVDGKTANAVTVSIK